MTIEKQMKFWHNPSKGRRLVTFSWTKVQNFDFQKITDPQLSLKFSIDKWNIRNNFCDDSIPMIRPEIGTGLIASAFGAELLFKSDNLPAVKNNPIQSLSDLKNINSPDPLKAGYFPQIYKVIDCYKKNMPANYKLCQCDIQGPWNTAQLLAGNKIFLDIYDDIDFVCSLLAAVTSFMIKSVKKLKEAIGEGPESFYLQGVQIPGGARICNCSTDMISPDFYQKYLMPHDIHFFEALGGGMMHICGNNSHCIQHFNRIEKLYALEVNFNYLDVFRVSEMLREDVVLFCTGPVEFPLLTPLGEQTLQKFYKGNFPDKRNIIFHFNDPLDLNKCKKLYEAIKQDN
ncbi:MAG: hypothetical protein A2Y10_05685 [Planctomycetes bacterium GWF2_41_51]|nr:MAG: hypothetical protein A2Y10_05685 [Planctomycetes bacterium GWF2_41_51]